MRNSKLLTYINVTVIALLVSVSIGLTLLVFALLYNVQIRKERSLLRKTAKSIAELIESTGKFDAMFYQGGSPKVTKEFTISKIRETQKNIQGLGKTGEILLAEKINGQILFLLQSKKQGYLLPPIFPYKQDSRVATPMRLALTGKSGTTIALDYKGNRVLAAYEYLPFMKMGLVVKIDTMELLAPVIKAALAILAILILFLASGIFFYMKKVPPLVAKVIKTEQEENELIHVMCHDLNNSFTVIKLALDMTKSSDMPLDSFRTQLNVAARNGQEIISMVREMETLVTKGVKLSEVNVCEAFKESLTILSNKIEEKNITMTVRIPENISVMADKRALVNSIFNNLVTNAVKFSFENGEIVVSVVSKGSDFFFSIQDFGVGIPDKMIDKIFDVGKSVSREGTKGERGTGFGMSLVHKFVKKFNGEIKLESKDIDAYPEDHGTTITIIFPQPTETYK